LKALGVSGAVLAAGPLNRIPWALAEPAVMGLSDPVLQPKFSVAVPDALAPGFKYDLTGGATTVGVGPATQWTGLRDPLTGAPLDTPVWGYGTATDFYSWPGRTFEVRSYEPLTVTWVNDLVDGGGTPLPYLITGLDGRSVVDESLHWAYSLPFNEGNTLTVDGVPIVVHIHGGHSDAGFDGNPEYFFSPGFRAVGPRFTTNVYHYDHSQPAGAVWYHDHALGMTRLNVYSGMAGFYFIRDDIDTGTADNPLGLPAWPYEKAYAIQDRMFKANGELFYPAFEGDPFWDDFIEGEGATPPVPGGPSALAEFFGDHIVVNGKIWPYEMVRPRNYRLRLLNGCDSRFLGIRFRAVPAGSTTLEHAGEPIEFYVIGSDQSLGFKAAETDTLLMGPGERYDVVFDFKHLQGMRVIMENIGGDAPFGGDLVDRKFPEEDLFPDRQTDRVMAFDVMVVPNEYDGFDPKNVQVYQKNRDKVDRVRKVALFEGMDEYGRLQPLLGTAEPATDYLGNPIVNPETGKPFEGAIAWHSPTTENPALGSTEEWEIYNATEDAHPVHLHLVNFEVLERQRFRARLVEQPVLQHNGTYGTGFRLEKIRLLGRPDEAEDVERAAKDMVTALPGQVTRIKAKFDKPGRYVWHCHILSHEDHEMMRVLHVGEGAFV
jgi:FtsP/CotA-like multicopper oxidase with cupredoxin domain